MSSYDSRSIEYRSFASAKERCKSTNRADYYRYGGRGIKFLYSSFKEFLADVGLKPTAKHSLDRIDVEGHYEPGNCRWATSKLQAINRRGRSDNTSGYRGVQVRGGRYHASIGDFGLRLYLGSFATAEAAAKAYDEKALELRGSEAKLNFPIKKPPTSQVVEAQSVAA
jgi:hypothetical protein